MGARPSRIGEDAGMDDYSTERFAVIRHHDARGTWYRIIDKQNGNATIKAFRSQKVAHRYCRETNSGWRRVHERVTPLGHD